MNHINTLFLEALKAAIKNTQVTWGEGITAEDWEQLFKLADDHNILPMIYEAVYNCPAISACDPMLFALKKRATIQCIMVQTMKTAEFMELFSYLRENGITPCVVKGIVCRNIYPNPDSRLSGDEDIFIPAEQFTKCHEILLKYGMQLSNPQQNIEADYEVPYGKSGSPIYIELHKHLFAPDEAAYGEFNRYFEGIHERLITITYEQGEITTMPFTEHFFYLVCHAFKHFIHGGFGIRQVCDIFLFAQTYGRNIDWNSVLKNCQEINAEKFTASMFAIGEKYLTFDVEKACLTPEWRSLMNIDETNMLCDLLDAGVYGNTDENRKHSSTITVAAVAAQKQGKTSKNNVISALFPPAESLKGRYKYLEGHKYLLPIAWGQRILGYKKRNSAQGGENLNAAEILKFGNERLELLREYGVIKK